MTFLDEIASLIASSARAPGNGEPDDLFPAPSPSPLSFTCTEEQQRAVDQILTWRRSTSHLFVPSSRFMKLTGAAGTGKTSVLQVLRERLRGTRTAWSAMTGKAASRMREAAGLPGKTLHSVLYHPPREVDRPVNLSTVLVYV